MGARRGSAARGAGTPGPRLRREPGGGDLLRPQDRLPRDRCAWAFVAVRHLPDRLPDARPLRPRLPGRGQRRPPPGHDPPGLLGSMERFAGILIEHYGGRFPAWLAPVQAAVLPVSDGFPDYGREVAARLAEVGSRVRVDDRTESVGRTIRDAELAKLPFMLVVGERERSEGTASV